MNITEKLLQGMKPGEKRQQVRDEAQIGFGVRVEPKVIGGRISFFWNAKVGGQIFFRSLGQWPETAVKTARDEAGVLAGKAKAWRKAGCPSSANPFKKEEAAATTAAPTFRQVTEAYIKFHLHDPKTEINHPDQAEKDLRWYLTKHFASWLERRVDEITIGDVVQLRDAAAKTPYVANRLIQHARAILAWCTGGKDGKVNAWELAGNSAAKVELFPEKERVRYLSPAERVTLEDALDDPRMQTPPDLKDFILLALDTAARKKSLLLMEWTEIDFDLKQWTIPASKSKSGQSYTVDLLPRAVETLERRRAMRTLHPHVFQPVSGQYLHLDKPFRKLMARIGGSVTDIRIHDLRRTAGCSMADAGASLELIASVLGQESVSATGIYARRSQAAIKETREAGDRKAKEQMETARRRMQQPIVMERKERKAGGGQ
jgi:integrase